MTTRRVAAVDCGTNSIRLLIADLDTERMVATDISRQMRIVRLGEGVDRTGRLANAAIDRTIAALGEYAEEIRSQAPEEVRMVATSATRDAENSAEFTRRVKEVLGVEPEVVSGDEEAGLSFSGATRELAGTGGGPYLVADIGGGSTEFVEPRAHVSVNIGCVRITERRLHGDPPSSAEVAAATADIDAALDTAAETVPVTGVRTLVGLAGSVTTVAAIALGLEDYDAERIHHSRISATQAHEISSRLLAQTRAERAAIPVMHPGRVDVIGAGSLILDRIMTRFGFTEVLVSEHDILDGIAWNLVQ
ncbi:MAG: Ppx/GppA family phosphatase [Nocardiopsaceae bacterium]|nr:Ppx/GppA family phosphatase [Nocardiopsaceae bacterium]